MFGKLSVTFAVPQLRNYCSMVDENKIVNEQTNLQSYKFMICNSDTTTVFGKVLQFGGIG